MVLFSFVNISTKKKKEKKESLYNKVRLEGLSRLPAKKFLQIKNQSIKKLFCWNPQGLAFTDLEAGLSLLLFFLFCSPV